MMVSPARFSGSLSVAAFVAFGCVSASQTPLANAEAEGHDVYYYGDASMGGKELPEDEEQKASSPTKKATPTKTVADKADPKPDAVEDREPKEDETEEGKDGEAKEAAKGPVTARAGTYEGSDTVTIRMRGMPERVEEDPNASMRVEAKEPGKLVFKIIDSNSGDPLCSVNGKAEGSRVNFEPGQTCLSEILGAPMNATLTTGSASFDGDHLQVDFEIDLELETPAGPVEGEILYHFEGKRK